MVWHGTVRSKGLHWTGSLVDLCRPGCTDLYGTVQHRSDSCQEIDKYTIAHGSARNRIVELALLDDPSAVITFNILSTFVEETY